jgi:serine/threonine-protein phosphatase 2A regulatory subunit B''
VLNLLDDAKAGRPLQAPTLPQTPTGQSPLSPSSTNALFSATPSLATPPLSPQKGAHSPVPGSPVSPARRLSQAARESQTAQTGAAGAKRRAADVIPRFYFGGEQLAWSDEQSAVKLAEAALLFNGCELPGYFAPLLMHRINGTDPIAEDPTGADASAAPGALTAPAAAPKPVTWTKFTEYWNSTLRKFQEPNARVF